MSQDRPQLEAAAREHLGTKYARRLRRNGQLPAVVYGQQKDPSHVSVDHDQLVHHLHHGAHVVDLKIDGGKAQSCLIKDIQYDYLGTDIVHVDLTRINLNEKVEVSVPIEIKGEDKAPGAKETGAIVEQPLGDLTIQCLPANIPDSLVADISHMELDETFLVRDLPLPEGVSTEHPEDDVVVSVHTSRASLEVDEAEAEAEAASAEPEVIGASEDKEGEGDEA
ncbi:MAG: 50S ribosomal protein L25 [Phycisphaeraceae bacterium]|nr:50S ribosomal protein L25 [Phycisphaeraceae bacterium]